MKLDSNYLPFLAYMKFCKQNFISRSSRLYFRWNSAFLCELGVCDTPRAKKVEFLENWWAQVDSNHRPHAYQACALTTWAMSPYKRWPLPFRVVEMNGIEPMTPCLQSRCSPSWATPPYSIWILRHIPLSDSSFHLRFFYKTLKIKQRIDRTESSVTDLGC